MARFEVTLPTDMIRQLDKLGSKGDEISQNMLKAGAAILKDKIDKNLKKNLYSGRKYDKNYPTGALERSTDKPKKIKMEITISAFISRAKTAKVYPTL